MSHKFFGGVHPSEHKDLTERKSVVEMECAPAQVVIPMSMHIGAPCKPLVAKGDTVKVGQVIGEVTGLGAPIHASVSGTVLAVEPRPHANGGVQMAVVIENDFQDTVSLDVKPRKHVDKLTPKQIIELAKDAGITGMGGAGFPTHVKLAGAVGKVDTIIINAAECEPYITVDHRLMLERGEAVIAGARLLMKAVELEQITIGIEGNKIDAIEYLKDLLPRDEKSVKIETLKTRYPQGAEKQLIQKCTGRQVPPGALPSDVGCCVINVATAVALYDAVTTGMPLVRRSVTITGGAFNKTMNVMAPIGTPVEHFIQLAGGYKTEPQRLLMGGPMMGNALFDTSAPMMKGTNCILALTDKEAAIDDAAQNCIRCGKCVDACPMHLMPLYMRMFSTKYDWQRVEEYNIMDCMECGSCNYVCPARIHLVQTFRMAKYEIRGMKAKEAAKA